MRTIQPEMQSFEEFSGGRLVVLGGLSALVLLSHEEEYLIEITWFFGNESFFENSIISRTSSNY
jgi:hypothetical protein